MNYIENMLIAQEYTQLKTELNKCIEIRNNLNTFMITTFVAVLALAYKYAWGQPHIFCFAQLLMVPVLWRVMNYKRTEYRLSKFIQDKFGDPWEKTRSKNNAFYFEFFILSIFVTVLNGYFLIEALCNNMIVSFIIVSVVCVISSVAMSAVILFLSYKSYRLSTENCDESWCEILFG
jgi:hypothetical protein